LTPPPGAFQAGKLAAHLFREQDHVTIVRRRHAHDLKPLPAFVDRRNAAANAVPRIHGKTHVTATINDRQARVVDAPDLVRLQRKTRCLVRRPMHTVVAKGRPQVGALQPLGSGVAIVVAKYHRIPAANLGHAGVKDQRRMIGNIRCG